MGTLWNTYASIQAKELTTEELITCGKIQAICASAPRCSDCPLLGTPCNSIDKYDLAKMKEFLEKEREDI